MNLAILPAASIGVVAGLRSLTAPAVVAWAAYLGWIHLQGSPLAFMGSIWAVGIFTILALSELIADKLPSAPARTAAVGLSARIVTGALSGACLAVAGGASQWVGAILGIAGALIGTFAGYHARAGLVRGLRVPDVAIAIPEDIIAIGLGLFLASRF
ncbi:MAG: DUF4126 family protein [Candidatus Sulfotelmatobacter sp.]